MTLPSGSISRARTRTRGDANRTDIVKVGGCGSKQCKQNEDRLLERQRNEANCHQGDSVRNDSGHNAQRHSTFVIPQMSDLVLIPERREDEN